MNSAREQRSPAIEIASLSKAYGGGRRAEIKAVQTISLSVGAGEVFGLLGTTERGRTTTTKMMAGLVTPSAGRFRYPSGGGG